ncbi:hypothetical protein CTAM01_14216 [Colletotrichum tamarilloi]|uniref:2EXR domain-containing protein n=1 Tax=Colletotrichum tamarilloi TaxID=1209934 RepID=A0ABQ9QPU0_9PEZI|nr:uncharacterized protein CTAM01_14216 [Colletotrichum tamarilloi]KAK1480757.1 hypothetical protein CTAM01_14216 [Colletotrichum tamarilloi]
MPDSSDESGSDGVGLMQNDASDRESSDSESGTEAGDAPGQGFLDVEASEEGNSDSDDSSESDSEDASILGEYRRKAPRVFFPEFRRLPIELRHRIWQYFCPDLHPSPRVFSFQVLPNPRQDTIWESTTLENQIAAVDAMLRVHHESRDIALKAFPDTLAIREGRRIVRFNKERDVVHLNGVKRVWDHNLKVPGFSENIMNMAMDGSNLDANELRLLLAFPNLKNLFDFQWHNDRRIPHRLRWCASDLIHNYEIQQLRRNVDIGEDLHFVYCWPDLTQPQNREFALKKNLSKDEIWIDLFTELFDMVEEGSLHLKSGEAERLEEVSYWPMQCFGWDAADRFDAFRAKHGVADGDKPAADGSEDDKEEESGDDSEEDSDDSSDQNEYESEGIDDGSIHEESVDEDEDDLLIDTQHASDDEEGGGGVSDYGGFSPLANEDSTLFDGNGPRNPAAHWSSPEPESGEDNQPRGGRRRRRTAPSDEDEESGEEEEAEDSGRSTSRRGPVAISDDEDEGDEEQPSQPTSRRGRVVLSDDEDDDEEEAAEKPAKPTGRRARVLPSDDDDEDDDEGGADIANKEAREASDAENEEEGAREPLSLAEKLARNRRDNPVSEDEEESGEESSEEEEEAQPKTMSLAQKLMTHRRRNPIASESEDEPEGSIVGSEDDDLEDEEDEDDEDDENGMFMNLADEGESGDEEGDEDEY